MQVAGGTTLRQFKSYPAYKDSGVEWLGDIPAHWEVQRTKYVALLRSGHTPSRLHPEYWLDCTIPWFGLADVWQIDELEAKIRDAISRLKELRTALISAAVTGKIDVRASNAA